jgi:aspartyl-tRNA(Asn)/glutamyl-tRNA(Gln) amidotransferase subunit A
MASSLDCPGPLTKTVEDSALILNVLAGWDKYDSTSSPKKSEDYTRNLKQKIAGIRIGIAQDYFENAQDNVKVVVEDALKVMENLGAKLIRINLFDPKFAIAVYTILQRAEVSSNLARYDGIRFGNNRSYFGAEAKRRIMLGTYALSSGYYDAYYSKAQKVRTVIVEDFVKSFNNVDLIIGPTAPTPALKLGASSKSAMFGEMMDILVEPSAIAGLPGINIPCGFTETGLPVGMQIIGPQFAESFILNVAYQYEQATQWHERKPDL